MFPEYRKSDGHRNEIGQVLLPWLPAFVKTSSGFHVAMMGAGRANNSFVRKILIKTTPYGVQVGPVAIKRKPWGLSRIWFSAFGIFVGTWK